MYDEFIHLIKVCPIVIVKVKALMSEHWPVISSTCLQSNYNQSL